MQHSPRRPSASSTDRSPRDSSSSPDPYGSSFRELIPKLLEVAAYDLREGEIETPELTELDFRFLFLLSEHSPIC